MFIEDKIYSVLTKRRYNRDEPFLKDRLKERFHYYVLNKVPIKLVGFWGVGKKSKPNWADTATCNFFSEINKSITMLYPPGIEYTFIFATLHGIHNGISKESIRSYTIYMEKLFNINRFKFLYLDMLWEKYGISFKVIDMIYNQKPKGWWNKVKNAKIIEKNAANRNLRLNKTIAAQKYYIMRDLEKKMLEEEFSDSIFHAFSDSNLRNVLPNLPTLYLFSRKGWSDAPWFVSEERDLHK